MSYRTAASQVRSALRANPSCIVELLETRQLLSASLVRGILRVDGAAATDTIRILDTDRRRGRLVVEINGRKSIFTSKGVKRIDVGSKTGTDKVYAKFAAGQVRGRTLRLLNSTAQLQVSGDRASLAGMRVSVGAASSVFSAKSGTWVSTASTAPVRWSAVQVANKGNTITSVLASAVMSSAVVVAPAQSIWPATTVPGVTAIANDSRAVQLGLKFVANVAGSITGIRFYKGKTNTGTHTGLLWTTGGKQLAKVTFANETPSGWQQALFSTPVRLTPGTTYIASYIAPTGCYADDETYFNRGSYTSGDLTALNSVYRYGTTESPTGNWFNSNYYVDVVFLPDPPAPVAPSALSATAISPSQINLAWADNSTRETGFEIERRIGLDGAWTQIATMGANVTTFADTMVAPGLQYSYRVDATSDAGDSAYSNEASATPAPAIVAPPAPSNLAAVAGSSAQINLSWADNSANETGFKIDRKIGLDGAWAQIATMGADVTAFADTMVAPATQYFYRVSATNTAGDSAATAEASATTLPTLPAAPSGLAASVVSTSDINLNWTDSSTNETGFAVECKLAADTAWSRLITLGSNVTSYSITGLAEAKSYSFRVLSLNSAGESSSSSIGVSTLPNAPSALLSAAVSTSQINLSWTDNSAGETGYRIDRRTGAAGAWTPIATLAANTVSFSNAGLSPSTQYYYRVAAIGSGGTSLFSAESAATTLAPPPAAPTALAVGDVHSSVIGLTWADNSNNETGFAVERKLASDSAWTRIATLAANSISYSDTRVTEATAYSFRVLALNAAGGSVSAAVNATTLPAAPTGLYVTNLKSTSLDLNWTDNSSGESGYSIDRKLGATGTWAQIATVGANITTYHDSNLTQGADYVYRMRAYKAPAIFSGYAGEVSVATPLPMAAPGNLAATVMSGVEVDLKWTDNSGDETGFKIERSTNGTNFTQIGTVAANVTTYADTAASGGTRYWYRVRAAGTGGDSAYSNQPDITTAPVLAPGTGWTGPTAQPDPVGTVGAAGYDAKAIARWDVVPYQTFDGAFNVGVVAFHMNEIDHVSFSVNGGAWSDVYTMTVNPQTGNHSDVGVQSDGVVEYWATLKASDFADGQVEVRAIAWPKVGVARVLQGPIDSTTASINGNHSMPLNADAHGTLSASVVYVSKTGSDTASGAIDAPKATIDAAFGIAGDGGTIIIKDAGDYPVSKLSGASLQRYVTIRPADYLSRDQVIILGTGGRILNQASRVHWQNVTIDDAASTYDVNTYSTGGQEAVWFDGVRFTSTAQVDPTTGKITNGGFSGNKKAVYLTRSVRDRGYNGFKDARFIRSCEVYGIQEDAYTNAEMIVNSTVHDIVIAPGVHSDIYQSFGGKQNVIVFGLDAWNVPDTQGLFLGNEQVPAGEYAMLDSAFVNINLDHTGNVAAQSQVKGKYGNILYTNIHWTAQSLNFRTDLGLDCANFIVSNSVFNAASYNKYILLTGYGAGVPDGVTFIKCIGP